MATNVLRNAAPMVVDLGTKDLSSRVVPYINLDIPQHLPKFYIFAEKGPIGPNFVVLSQQQDSLVQPTPITDIYGKSTFDVTSKYYTHQTVFVNAVVANGNNCVIHRVVPPDIKDVANITLYLDVLPTQVPLYAKYSDGSLIYDENGNPTLKLDSNGDPIYVPGFKVKWVTDYDSVPLGQYEIGLKTQRAGTQSENGVQSIQYPIFEYAAYYPGEAGNRLAIRLYPALQSDTDIPFPTIVLTESKNYPYYFRLYELINPKTGTLSAVLNKLGSSYTRVLLQKDAIDPITERVSYIDTTQIYNYIEDEMYVNTNLGSVHCYSNNLTELAQMFYNAEKNIDDPHRDSVINNLENNIYALNMLGFTSSNGSPYQSIKLIDDVDSIRLTKNTNIFLKGASDGTISEEILDELVYNDLLNYEDPLHEYNDLVLHPESIIYDSGFTLKTKKAFPKFISNRKDTFVVLSTYAHDAPASSVEEQYSIAIGLKTMLELYPESSTFGTPVMRGMIVGGSGKLVSSNYNKRVPVTYEIAYKSARYMGAANGAWKSGYSFDRAPGSVITQLTDIDVTWVPSSTRNHLWAVGLNFALNYQIRTQYFPALKTVYSDDTSVLNSYFTAVAISYLHKVIHAAWREFTGSISLTNAQLVEKLNAFIAEQVKNKFDNKFVIVPNATITDMDNLKGYSFTCPVKIYAPNMKTVMTAYVESYRIEDLAQQG